MGVAAEAERTLDERGCLVEAALRPLACIGAWIRHRAEEDGGVVVEQQLELRVSAMDSARGRVCASCAAASMWRILSQKKNKNLQENSSQKKR